MKKELALKQIFDDFVSKTILSDEEKDILIRYIKNDTIIKIASDTSISSSSVSRIISSLKAKYKNYKQIEMAKLTFFQKNKW